MYIYTTDMPGFGVDKKKDISFPGTGITNSSELPCGYLEINSSLL